MRYCNRCVLPDTRPGIEIARDGVCSACRTHGRKEHDIDWVARRAAFESLVSDVKALARPYDCVIPVSGGKDSTWQTIKCLELGLHSLAVTWKTPARTQIGAANLANLIELGVDHIDFQVNPNVERRFLMRALETHGTTAIPMHLAIFNVPLAIAAKFEVPLVVWGEDSASEYVGDADERSFRLDSEWVRRYGAMHGTTAADWVSDDLTEQDLTPYFGPSDEELEQKGVQAIFLGYFFQWDPAVTSEVARSNGFRSRDSGPKTGYYDYADIDDDFISIHHYLKWHKFGFTRSYDNLSLEIRNGRMTRDEAIGLIRERGDETPHEDIRTFCDHVGITTERFYEVIERFRNLDVWSRRGDTWVIEDFLIPDWPWDGVAQGAR